MRRRGPNPQRQFGCGTRCARRASDKQFRLRASLLTTQSVIASNSYPVEGEPMLLARIAAILCVVSLAMAAGPAPGGQDGDAWPVKGKLIGKTKKSGEVG